jgi:hypothetical protein
MYIIKAAVCMELGRKSSFVMAGLGLAWPGHPRLGCGAKTWMPATSAGMTV